MKRLLAIVLTLCLLATVFCGCGDTTSVEVEESTITVGGDGTASTDAESNDGSGNTQGGTSVVTSTTQSGGKTSATQSGGKTSTTQNGSNNTADDWSDMPKYDLKGATISIVQEGAVFATKKGSTQSSKKAYEAMQKIQKELNCKVSMKTVAGEQLKSDLLKNQLSGTKYADIISLRTYNMAGLLGSALTDLNTIKSMNLKKDYMNFAKALDTTKIAGKNFILFTPNTAFATGKGVFFNKSILKEIGYKDSYIYDLASSGKWTISKMRELAKKAVLDKDGKTGLSEKDRFGIIINDFVASGGESMLAASHVDMLTVNKNGTVKLNTDSTAFVNAVNLARDVYVKDGTAYTAASNDMQQVNMFKTGHGLFMLLSGDWVSHISTMDADFGFVPFPTVDGKYESTINWNYASIAIPSGLSDTEIYNAGAFLQAFCYTEQKVVDTKYQEWGVRYFRDSESTKFLKISNESQKIPLSSLLGTTSYHAIHSATYTVLYQCIPGTEKSITSMVSSAKGAAQNQLDEIIAKVKK